MAPAEQSKQTSAQELLAERKRLEEEFEARYTKRITVMFTDLVGSTSITETHGDIVTREMIKHHDDIIRERIEANQGKLVKTLGDGTMSYFPNTLCAIDAAVTIQNALAELNELKKLAVPIKVRRIDVHPVGGKHGNCRVLGHAARQPQVQHQRADAIVHAGRR